jgi:uroporphyrinogen-III synthase/uroporphyrinogen III methyltransferase/synthase
MSSLPLVGRRVLVTRAAHQAGKLSEGLRALGAEPVEIPVLEIRPPVSYGPLDKALCQLDSYDWLIVTSANTVRSLVERTAELGLRIEPPVALKVAAIGDATAAAVRRAGFPVTLVPESYVAESLLKDLTSLVSGRRVLLARASVARDVIPDVLREAGAEVDVVDAYRNVLPKDAPEKMRGALAAGIDAATFTSSSSATHLAEAAREAKIAFPFRGVAAISIGPVTSHTLQELRWKPAAEANPSDIPGLIAAVVNWFSR